MSSIGSEERKHTGSRWVSVQVKIIAALIPTITAVIALMIVFVRFSSVDNLEKMNTELLAANSRSVANEVAAWTGNIFGSLEAQCSGFAFLEGMPELETAYIRSTRNPDSPYPDGLYVAMEDKRYIFSEWRPEPGYDPTARHWYQEGLTHESFAFGDAYHDMISDQIVVSATCVLRNIRGEVRGVAGCDIQLSEVSKIVASVRMEESGGVFLVDAGTLVLIGSADSSETGSRLTGMPEGSVYRASKQWIEDGSYGLQEAVAGGEKQFFYLERVPGCNWVCVSYVPRAEIMSEASRMTTALAGLALMGMLLLIGLVHFLLRKIVIVPVRELDGSVQRIADGNLDVAMDFRSNDEFGRVADNLGRMTRRLRSYVDYIGDIVTTLGEIGGGNLSFRSKLDYEGEFSRVKEALVSISESLSEAREKEEQAKLLESEKKAADAANQAKSRFLAQMSHEIRTPINAVLGMNEMILSEAKEEQILDYASNIDYAGRQLLSIINTILDFSKIEDGKMEIVPDNYDLASVLHNLVNGATLRSKMKSLNFYVEVDESLPAALYGDDVRVTQVIQNILTNAIKYTEEGSVTFSVKNGGREGDDVFLDVSVRDTGIGIREEDMEKLFASFERLDTRRNRTIEGTGLGMAIVVSLLRMMGSSLQVESTYGKGSVFSFRLRQRVVDARPIGNYAERVACAARQQQKDATIHAPEARVLVVDDNAMNLKVAKNLLKLYGIAPDLAKSGAEAVNLIRERFYDIVLMDHMMPVMDGIETLRMLKSEDLIPPGMSVLVLTANAVAGAKEEYLAEGFADYLSKPINTREMEEKLIKFLPGEKITWRRRTKGAPPPAPEKKAPPAESAKSAPKAAPAKSAPKAAPKAAEESVLEFGPSGAAEEVLEFGPEGAAEEALEFGPEGAGEDALEFGPAGAAENAAEPGPDGGAPAAGGGSLLERLASAGLNTETGLRYCSGDLSFYEELLGDFTAESGEKVRELESFYATEAWGEYRIRIHALKSVAKTLGANALFEQAKELEAAAANADADYLHGHHADCLRLYRSLSEGIENALGGA